MSALAQRILFFLTGFLGRWVIALYYTTVRIVSDTRSLARLNRNPSPTGIYAFWHSHQLSTLWRNRGSGAAILISQSRDGEYVARLAAAFGYEPVRGSSSRRGAVGLMEMIRVAGTGRPVAITPDGPRGPRHTVHAGVLALAQKTGLPIVPMAVGHSRFWQLRSWDRFRIPKPFSKGYSCTGAALHVPPDADEAALERLAAELRARMIALEELADRKAAGSA